jgi:hypothetical protein
MLSGSGWTSLLTVSRYNDGMVDPARGEAKTRLHVFGFQIGQLLQDLLSRQPGREQIEHVRDPDAHPPDAGTAAALARVYSDSFQ